MIFPKQGNMLLRVAESWMGGRLPASPEMMVGGGDDREFIQHSEDATSSLTPFCVVGCSLQNVYPGYNSPSQYGVAGSYSSSTPQQPPAPGQHQGNMNQVRYRLLLTPTSQSSWPLVPHFSSLWAVVPFIPEPGMVLGLWPGVPKARAHGMGGHSWLGSFPGV